MRDDLEIKVRKESPARQPSLRRVYRLEDLVKRITPRNVHDEIDFGGTVGREEI